MTTRIAPGVGANLLGQHSAERNQDATTYVGNLDPQDVDEKLLYDTFSAFGVIVTNPKIMRDPETGNSRGFGFVSYDSFESSDQAIEAMNNQHFCNRPITVSYAYKKDTKGERHGTPAERLLAANNPGSQRNRPHTMFASGPPTQGLANGGPPVPRPYGNGTVPGQIPHIRPPPPGPVGQFPPPMQMHGQPAWPGPPHTAPPPMPQQLQYRLPVRPPPPNMMPPPVGMVRPPPPPAGMPAPPMWMPPPPPPQQGGGMPPPPMSMPPPPPPPSG
ncbi:Splicing factor 3B subunit 4 [Dichanthelium oligosanthes]|uniref:Splicing factor 3B subunit 4 n=1 Tax=Dichanthelium oligosanthes TaxID=888268 RepID=A0A1E5VUS0_9POAL|nr:Splicing factor 3B subunit 4 [Dichanthelium oligosanthes]